MGKGKAKIIQKVAMANSSHTTLKMKEKRGTGLQTFLRSMAKVSKKLSFISTIATQWPALLPHAIHEITSFDSQSCFSLAFSYLEIL